LQKVRLSRLSELYRAGNGRLSRYQDILLPSVLIVAVSLTAMILVPIFSALLSPRTRVAMQLPWGEGRQAEHPGARYRGPGKEEGDLSGLEARFPEIDWSRYDLRRQAASTLCFRGDLRGAIELLGKDDPHREELLKVSSSSHVEVLEALENLLPEEEKRLLEFLEGEEGRQIIISSPKSGTIPIQDYGRILPEGLFFRFVVNLHARLRERTGASDEHLKLLLESRFPPGSPARKLYRESKSLRPLPYGAVPGAPSTVK